MKKLLSLSIAAATLATTQTALAEDKNIEKMTVTASRIEMPLRTVGSSVTVLDEIDIESSGKSTVAELLRLTPSIGVSNTGGLGSTTTIRVRGEEGFRTKVIVDGIDISDPTGTQAQPQIQHLLTANIERLEVLRGPQGMMYGADAGGVINIITKKPTKGFEGDISAEYGRYNTKQVSANIRGKTDKLSYTLIASDLSTDGFNSRASDTTYDEDGYDNTTIGASVSYALTENFSLRGVIRDVDSDSEFDRCGFPSTNQCEGEFEQTSYKLDAIISVDKLEQTFSYIYTETERLNEAAGITSFETEGELNQLQSLTKYSLSESNTIVAGIDWQEDEVTSSSQTNSREQLGGFIEWQSNIDEAFFYTIGFRHDDNDDFGSQTSERVTVAYLPKLSFDGELKLKASYGTGFRAPSLSEIAYNNGPFAYPPGSLVVLSQEESKGWDAGFEYTHSNGARLEIVYFDQEIENEIDFDLVGFSGYLQGNGTTESNGVEVSAELPVTENLLITANYTYNDTEDSNGDQRIRRPEDISNIGIHFQSDDSKWNLAATMRFVSNAEDEIFGVGRVELDDYEVLDLNASYRYSPQLEFYVRAENVLDEEYEEVTGFNTARASAYAGIRYSF